MVPLSEIAEAVNAEIYLDMVLDEKSSSSDASVDAIDEEQTFVSEKERKNEHLSNYHYYYCYYFHRL
jgi:hypothetical protein